jgi:hypothetical protein
VEQRVQQYRVVEEVFANQVRCHVIGNDDQGRQPPLHGRCLAKPEGTILGLNTHKRTTGALSRQVPAQLEGVYFGNFQVLFLVDRFLLGGRFCTGFTS